MAQGQGKEKVREGAKLSRLMKWVMDWRHEFYLSCFSSDTQGNSLQYYSLCLTEAPVTRVSLRPNFRAIFEEPASRSLSLSPSHLEKAEMRKEALRIYSHSVQFSVQRKGKDKKRQRDWAWEKKKCAWNLKNEYVLLPSFSIDSKVARLRNKAECGNIFTHNSSCLSLCTHGLGECTYTECDKPSEFAVSFVLFFSF